MRAVFLIAASILLGACGHPIRHTAGTTPAPPIPFTPPEPPPPVVVRDPAPSAPPPAVEPSVVRPAAPDFDALLRKANEALADAYFDYDRSDITSAGLDALRTDAAILAPLLKEFPQLEIVVEGHCDERGSAAYNLGLGARRAERAIDVLATFGIPRDRLHPISYGSERPQCEVSAESCWKLNRRAHLSGRGGSPRTAADGPDHATADPEREPE